MRTIELLSPAKNLECGIEAIRHGADAVYIGAGKYGARSAAGNSLEDIVALVNYAHFFKAKVYVAVNTLLYDDELEDVTKLIRGLWSINADAIIVQDFGILNLDIPPIPLHASTQMDNRNVSKVEFLQKMGFEQVVLARELSLKEIAAIHEKCPAIRLEVFVHGALCVSMSGQCFMSEYCFNRSANRGECAQVCRMSFDMEDDLGNSIVKDKHLLSLKDMNRIDALEDLLDAGVTSLKIEGRLKDVDYVKNVTAAYSQKLNEIIGRRSNEFVRASSGHCRYTFTPDVSKSFNRGFTQYFLYGRTNDIFSFDTPKSVGENVGAVKSVFNNCFSMTSSATFTNGDGLCFIDRNGHLQGFRVNRADKDGMLYPLEMPSGLCVGMMLYRNYDQQFHRLLRQQSAERNIGVVVTIDDYDNGFRLTMTDEDGLTAEIERECEKELGRTHQGDNIRTQLSKLGNTGFEAVRVDILMNKNWFIPSSKLGEWRRELTGMLENERRRVYPIVHPRNKVQSSIPFPIPTGHLNYQYNVMNISAARFYEQHGIVNHGKAFELMHKQTSPLMTCRHCLLYSMGWCASRQRKNSPFTKPFYISLADGHRFRLDFDCKNCMMNIYADERKPLPVNKKLPKNRRP